MFCPTVILAPGRLSAIDAAPIRLDNWSMKKPAAGNQAEASGTSPALAPSRRIHPVLVYPLHQPADYSDLEALYQTVAQLNADAQTHARPITVMDRKTHHAMLGNKAFFEFRKGILAQHSDILDAWCVDTCQMWYSGLGLAFERGGPEDVYWLIPGDFNYGSPAGKDVLDRLHHIPELILEVGADFAIGEITTDHNHSKQLIDTYGTFALLYNWFPDEAQEIRQYTERPRSEFFAIRHSFLREVLQQRWYAYEQTVTILLQAVLSNRRIGRFCIGELSDLPGGRDSLASAVQQLERTERVLKTFWLERNQSKPGWLERFRLLENQSDQVRGTALTILGQLFK
jgi:hypothetical protein